MKKFENLGKKLSKKEQKYIIGGDEEVEGDCLEGFSLCCTAQNCKACCGLLYCRHEGGEQGKFRCGI